MNDRHEAKCDCDYQRDGKAKDEHGWVDADLADAREIAVIKADDQLHAPRREQRANQTCGKSEQERFDNKLSHQPRP